MKLITFDATVYNYFTMYHQLSLDANLLTLSLINPKELTSVVEADILIGGKVTRDNLNFLPNLKMVVVPFTGLDDLDLKTLNDRNIPVLNTSAHSHFVAERALALTLAIRCNIVNIHNELVKGNWSGRFTTQGFPWRTLQGIKVAVYGYGLIGQGIGELLKPFHVDLGILSYKGRTYEDVRPFSTLKELCVWCDVLIISAPLNETTKQSINDDILQIMTDRYIINVGRGDIIEEEALYNRLHDSTLAGFASDVWYQYPTKNQPNIHPSKFPFHELKNVIMTPHNAGFEETSRQVRYDDVLKIIVSYFGK